MNLLTRHNTGHKSGWLVALATIVILVPIVFALHWELSRSSEDIKDYTWKVTVSLGWNSPIDVAVNPSDIDILIRTLIGLAGGKSEPEQIALTHVILNRVKSGSYGGRTIRTVVLRDIDTPSKLKSSESSEFSIWVDKNERIGLLSIQPENPQYKAMFELVKHVILGRYPDDTNGSTHFSTFTVSDKTTCAKGLHSTRIGDYVFCKRDQSPSSRSYAGDTRRS